MEPVCRTTHEGRNQAARTASEDRERHNGDLAPSHPHAERGEPPRRASNRAKAPPERSCAGMPGALSRRVLAHSNCSRAGGSCGLVRHDDPSLLASDGPAGIGVGVVGHIAVEAGVPALKPHRGPAPAVPSSVSSRLTRYLQHPTSRSRPGPRHPMRHNRTRWDSILLMGALGVRRSRSGPRCGTRIRSMSGGVARVRLYQFGQTGTNPLFTSTPTSVPGNDDHLLNPSVAVDLANNLAFISVSRTIPTDAANGNAAMLILKGPATSSAGWGVNTVK